MDPGRAAPPGGGLLGRFENVRQRTSQKRIVPCYAATAEYLRNDYLKPMHLPIDRVDAEVNYAASSSMNETKFHKGFQRRNKAEIQPDAERLEVERTREFVREERAQASLAATIAYKERHTFNILTGEGVGRESEFRQVGKKVMNPLGSMEAVFSEHAKEANVRTKNSKHRFYDPAPPKEERTAHLFNEGLRETVRETAVLGYGSSGNRRTRTQSCGAADNYAHLRELPPEPSFEPPHYGNRSQIILG